MSYDLESLPLLRTKLYRPRATGDLIRRGRISELLTRQLDRPVTLICAPAGFGKTTVLNHWLDACNCPSAWVSLDKGDSNLSVFLSYFIAAVRSVFPSSCADTLGLLRAPTLPPLIPLVTTLVNDLDRLADDPGLPAGQRFVLVLDDYHLVHEPGVHALLGELLRRPPRALHLVVSARQEPPFPLHALRGRGELGEVRTQDLRFTDEEVTAFMQHALEVPLEASVLATLTRRTEGWATGLRLAALTLSAGGVVEWTELAQDDRYVLDYLLNEVLLHLPLATQDFLLKTSVLDHLCGPLCDAVVGTSLPVWDGSAYLEWLARENVFTFSLDPQGNWYRYHHLFQTLLRKRLERQHSREEIGELHARAGAWLAQMGLVEEAIEHLLAGAEELAAVRLVEAYRHQLMNREQWRQLEHWLSLLPRHLIDTHPELLMLEAWILQKQWRSLDLAGHLDRVESLVSQTALPESDCTRLYGEIEALRSHLLYYHLDGNGAVARAERALQLAPLECSFVRGTGWLFYAGGLQMLGDPRALAALREGLEEEKLEVRTGPLRLHVGICLYHWINADLPELLLAATRMLKLALERDLKEDVGWAHCLRGCARYQTNDLKGAEADFSEVMSQRYVAHGFPFSQSAFGLASVLLARGAFDEALEIVDSASEYAVEMSNTRIGLDAEAFRAYIALRKGAPAEARAWIASADPDGAPVPLNTFLVTRVLRAKVLLALGTAASLTEAHDALAHLHELARTTHNTRFLIETLALEALLHEARADRETSLAALAQALVLAEPGGMIRVFVDLGPGMAQLLAELAKRIGASGYLRRLLAAFGENGLAEPELSLPEPKPAAVSSMAVRNGDELIERLSERELEVLALLGERLSNKEIARELSISDTTVKRHTVNIYQKLAVGSRRDAVNRAAKLGLVCPPQPLRHMQS